MNESRRPASFSPDFKGNSGCVHQREVTSYIVTDSQFPTLFEIDTSKKYILTHARVDVVDHVSKFDREKVMANINPVTRIDHRVN